MHTHASTGIQRWCPVVALAGALACAAATPALGQSCDLVQTAYFPGGRITACCVASDAIVAAGEGVGLDGGVRIMATGVATSPAPFARLGLGETVVEIESDGAFVYALTPTRVVKIDPNPFDPILVHQRRGGDPTEVPPIADLSNAQTLLVSPTAYYVCEPGRLHVIPVGLDRTVSTMTGPRGIVTSAGGKVWVNTDTAVVRWGNFGATNPDGQGYAFGMPGFTVGSDAISGMFGSGSFLYVVCNMAAGADQLRVLRVNADFTLTQTGSLTLPWTNMARARMAVHENKLYIPVSGTALGVVNVTNPASPALLANLPSALPGLEFSPASSRDLGFLAQGHGGLRVFDITGNIPASIGLYRPAPTDATDVDEDGSIMFVADAAGSAWVYDILTATLPSVRGVCDLAISAGHTARVSASGGIGYVTTGTGVAIVNGLNPAAPLLETTFNMPGGGVPRDVLTTGTRLFVARSDAAAVYTLSSPDTPVFRSTLVLLSPLADRAQMGVSGGLLFVPTHAGVEVWNVGNPASPSRLQVLANPAGHETQSIAVFPSEFGFDAVSVLSSQPGAGGTANFALRHWFNDLFGFSFVAPLQGTFQNASSLAMLIAGHTDRALLATSRVTGYDYSNPGSPRVLGRFEPAPSTWSMTSMESLRMTGGATYATLGTDGWAVLTRPTNFRGQIESLDFGFGCPGGTVTLAASFFASPAITDYQWSFLGRDLSDPVALVDGPTARGSVISGSLTATLTISNIHPDEFGNYLIEARNTCGVGAAFTSIGNVGCCDADFNGDGELNADDLADYINCYFAAPPCNRADFNLDTEVNADDLADYINAYFAGC